MRRTGRFLRMPYDWRRPSWSRLRRRQWNPADRRILVPKASGWGYGINLAAVWRRFWPPERRARQRASGSKLGREP